MMRISPYLLKCFCVVAIGSSALIVHAKLPDCGEDLSAPCFYSGAILRDGKPSSERYEGEVKNGLRNGQGTYTFADGKKYIGQFKDDVFFGNGTLMNADGSKYVGQFKDDQMSGQGTYTWPDNSRYIGQFKNGTFHGQGSYFWDDGRKYVGDWKDNKKSGYGVFYQANGAIEKQGIWKDDLLVQAQTGTTTAPSVSPPKWQNSVTNQHTVTDSAQELKKQKCMKLGLVPGSDDFKLCMM